MATRAHRTAAERRRAAPTTPHRTRRAAASVRGAAPTCCRPKACRSPPRPDGPAARTRGRGGIPPPTRAVRRPARTRSPARTAGTRASRRPRAPRAPHRPRPGRGTRRSRPVLGRTTLTRRRPLGPTARESTGAGRTPRRDRRLRCRAGTCLPRGHRSEARTAARSGRATPRAPRNVRMNGGMRPGRMGRPLVGAARPVRRGRFRVALRGRARTAPDRKKADPDEGCLLYASSLVRATVRTTHPARGRAPPGAPCPVREGRWAASAIRRRRSRSRAPRHRAERRTVARPRIQTRSGRGPRRRRLGWGTRALASRTGARRPVRRSPRRADPCARTVIRAGRRTPAMCPGAARQL
ncbi:hypothetical protein CLV72_105189 [Allonocardiopsis opalescens]|uniref:Uncharacterized protein n=1 Tax=Allonocardiopsis opalescens TaxID=1144618 RepID=A0A2T0Q233_9ACTN|nr:hypothetical protein CLV72_105189 [Allonocardiopsis opalescens]